LSGSHQALGGGNRWWAFDSSVRSAFFSAISHCEKATGALHWSDGCAALSSPVRRLVCSSPATRELIKCLMIRRARSFVVLKVHQHLERLVRTSTHTLQILRRRIYVGGLAVAASPEIGLALVSRPEQALSSGVSALVFAASVGIAIAKPRRVKRSDLTPNKESRGKKTITQTSPER
jgi:hypothetical protein